MMQQLESWFSGLELRERRVVLIGAALIPLLVILVVLVPLQRSVWAAHARLDQKRADLAWLHSVEPSLGSLNGAAAAPQPLRQSLVVLVDQSARESGLGKAMRPSQANGAGSLSVSFEQAPFDALIGWLARLREQYGILADSASIDGTGTGTVNATLVLHAP